MTARPARSDGWKVDLVTEPLNAEETGRPRLGASGPVRVRVPAKINLHLGVGPIRPDGYHELTTVYHAVSLFDEVSARRGDSADADHGRRGRRRAGARRHEPGDPGGARAGQGGERTRPLARLHLRKQIPLAGGLAGGSADAAAALVACDALWGTGMQPRRSRGTGRRGRIGRALPRARRHGARHRPGRGDQPGARASGHAGTG